MYKNGDPKKKVAKADATSVTSSRYYPRLDQPLESSDTLFNNKESVAEMSGGLSGAAAGAAAGAKLGAAAGKYITSIKRAKRKQ